MKFGSKGVKHLTTRYQLENIETKTSMDHLISSPIFKIWKYICISIRTYLWSSYPMGHSPSYALVYAEVSWLPTYITHSCFSSWTLRSQLWSCILISKDSWRRKRRLCNHCFRLTHSHYLTQTRALPLQQAYICRSTIVAQLNAISESRM